MIHEKLRAGFRCCLLSSKTQILSPGRKSWVSLRTAVVHCVPGLLPRRKMSGSFLPGGCIACQFILLLMVQCMGIYSAALCMLNGSDDFCGIK
ncbi:hypothetical protein T03_10686, partial [Trichinella britovi]